MLGQSNTTTEKPATPPPAQSQPGLMEGMGPIILMVVVLFIFMFFMRRSQKKQADDQQKLIDSLKKGQKVMLNSGLFGRVSKVDKDEREIVLEVDENKRIELTYNVLAVARVVDEETKSVEPGKK